MKDSKAYFAVILRCLSPIGQTRKSKEGFCAQDRERDLNMLSDRKNQIPNIRTWQGLRSDKADRRVLSVGL